MRRIEQRGSSRRSRRARSLRQAGPFACRLAVAWLLAVTAASAAAAPAPRIVRAVDDALRVPLPGSAAPRVGVSTDAGALDPATVLQGVTIVFSRSTAQEAELQALLAAQLDPGSPLYHRWLTPDEFGARFGAADADLAATAGWARAHGLSVLAVSRARDRLRLSGTAAQLRAAFSADLRRFSGAGATFFAPAGGVKLPAALGGAVLAVTNLSSLRPRPHLRLGSPALAPRFTSGKTGSHFLTPVDVATLYDLAPAWAAGHRGAGQRIAVVGQSSVVLSDITAFQAAAGVPVRAPAVVVVPGSGTLTRRSGDEAESDLDLEYASAIAGEATVLFVTVGGSANHSVWDAIVYAIDQDLAPIVSVSYGTCEPALSASEEAALDGVLAQAAAQGQSVIVAAGDDGSTDCNGVSGLVTTTQRAPSVDFPAASQWVTALGGTQLSAADVASDNTTWWTAPTGADQVGSARTYIPEQAWNEDSAAAGLAAGGGGASARIARPSWQAGVPGLPAGTTRLVPDLSLAASIELPGYLYCSSDPGTKVSGSCTRGFRDASGNALTVAGGTSFAAPIFAGMLAVLGEATGTSRQGVVSATLYGLAADPTTYAAAFHDVTAGSNACTAGSTWCSTDGASGFAAGTGYDRATGLGSIDFQALLEAWPAGGTGFHLSATDLTLGAGQAGTSTITITPENGYAGTVAWTVASAPLLPQTCFTVSDTTVAGASATAVLTIDGSGADCAAALRAAAAGLQAAGGAGAGGAPWSARGAGGLLWASAAALLAWATARRRRSRLLAPALALAAVCLGALACGGGGSGSGSASGGASGSSATSYVVIVRGTDTASTAIRATTTLQLRVE